MANLSELKNTPEDNSSQDLFFGILGALYKTKKDLKASVGQYLNYEETSMFGPEYKPNGSFTVVGPSPHKRTWFALVTMKDDLIDRVD